MAVSQYLPNQVEKYAGRVQQLQKLDHELEYLPNQVEKYAGRVQQLQKLDHELEYLPNQVEKYAGRPKGSHAAHPPVHYAAPTSGAAPWARP